MSTTDAPRAPDTHRESVAVIGLGYVGLPLAVLAARKGFDVVGIDTDEEKIKRINAHESPFHDPELTQALSKNPIRATNDWTTLEKVSIVVVCVPTPVHDDYTPDLGPLTRALKSAAPHIAQGALVVIESTVNPGICESVAVPILEQGSNLRAGSGFLLAHCPERINPGDTHWNVSNISRVVGGLDEASLDRAARFYESLIEGTVRRMGNLKEAEAVKMVENTFRDINIAFVNELAMSFSHMGIDVVNVIEGAASKPFSFMAHFPGCGVGGHCIPVDPYYLIAYGRENGFNHRFLSLARKINRHMPRYTAKLTRDALKSVHKEPRDARVTVLGLSYKADIDDMRESPAFEIIEELKHYGMEVTSFDPYSVSKSDVGTLEAALADADAVVVATAHAAFRELTPADFAGTPIKVIIDGRNCLDKDAFAAAGYLYRGIGRTGGIPGLADTAVADFQEDTEDAVADDVALAPRKRSS